MQAGHTGDPTDVKGQQKKLDAVIDKWEYDTTHNIESGNLLGVATDIPAVTNILAPYGLGVGAGAIFKGAYGLSGLLARKGFKYTASVLKGGTKATGIGLGALAIGTAGYDVYTTHQRDSDKALVKALTYGTQFFSFGRGMKVGSKIKLPERKIDITHYKLTGQPEYMVGRKYFELFGKQIKYGKTHVGTKTNLGLGSGKPSTAPGTYTPPDLGYKSVGGRPLSIFDAKMTAVTPKTSGLGTFKWNKTTFIDTWKPTPSEWIRTDWLSTKVFPKPVVKGSYGWKFGVIDYSPYVTSKLTNLFGKNIYKIKSDLIIKPGKKIVDMGKLIGSKETKLDNMFKDTGGVSSGGTKQQTIQLLKTKTVSEQLSKTKTITEQISKSKTLSEQISKQLSKSEMDKMLASLSVFKPMYKTKSAFGSLQAQEQRSGLLFKPMYKTKLAYDTVQAQKQLSGLMFLSKSKQDTLSISAQSSLSLSQFETPSVSLSATSTISMLESDIDLLSKAVFKSFNKAGVKPITRPLVKGRTKQVLAEPLLYPSPLVGEAAIGSSNQAYNVFVKDRFIIKGKKAKPERFIKMSKHPLSRNDAFALGGTLVDSSAAASFKVKPTSGKPKPLKVNVRTWDNLRSKFYPKGDTFIEKNTYRIDTPGEIKGITAKGVLANMERASLAPIKKIAREHPRSHPRQRKEIAIDFDRGNIDIDPSGAVEREQNFVMKYLSKIGF